MFFKIYFKFVNFIYLSGNTSGFIYVWNCFHDQTELKIPAWFGKVVNKVQISESPYMEISTNSGAKHSIRTFSQTSELFLCKHKKNTKKLQMIYK